MAILICPECNGRVYDKSDVCIHCGYPIKDLIGDQIQKYTTINGVKYNVTNLVNIITSPDYNVVRDNIVSEIVSKEFDIPPNEFILAVMELKDAPKEINCKPLSQWTKEILAKESSKPRCPYCNSFNIEKISIAKKAISIGGLGILSNKIGKTYQCKNCKSTW